MIRKTNFPFFGPIWRRDERFLLDDKYYNATYDDVSKANIDPFSHFMTYGWREGRNPSANFSTLYYRDRYLQGRPINPLTHYIKTGRKNGFRATPASDDEYVAVQYEVTKDLFRWNYYHQQVGEFTSDLLLHYLSSGWREGKIPAPDFDPKQYLKAHAYIIGMDVCPFYHFASQTRLVSIGASSERSSGARKKRSSISSKHIEAIVTREFDRDFYLSRYADVRTAGLNPLKHFLKHGWREGRMPTPLFDSAYYLKTNPEVAEQDINPFYHFLTTGRDQGLAQNQMGSRLYDEMRLPEESEWDLVASAADISTADCVIVMPVFRGINETLASIHAILSAPQRVRFGLHVVNDCSPDADLCAALSRLSAKGLFHLTINSSNLGFVKSANRALRRHADQDVVLINSDAKVFHDWLDRIVAHARRDPSIATITPFTNNATIFSYPIINANNMVELEQNAPALDRIAARCNAGQASDVPVGVGFCLFVSAVSRRVVGHFDEDAFGRGYGEENDYCLRAAKAGFRNVLAEDVFVYHVGEISFGKSDKADTPGQSALLAKHPEYPEVVRQHLGSISTDWGRIRLDLMRLALSVGPASVVLIYHNHAGGLFTHVEQQDEKLRAEGTCVVHLRVAAGDRWSVKIRSSSKPEPFCPNLQKVSVLQGRDVLAIFLKWLAPRAIHVHSLVNLDWHATTVLLDLVRQSGIPYRFTLHDYSAVCHRNDLVQPNGRFCNLPSIETCRICVSRDPDYPEGVDPAVRRKTYAQFLEGAEAVLAPSRDIKRRLELAGARYPITVTPHEDIATKAPAIQRKQEKGVVQIATFGAIGAHKGSRVILSLARDAITRALPIKYNIIGYSDVPTDMKLAGVVETGLYETNEEAIEHALRIAPSCIFLPSIWPETYCFTLSLAFTLDSVPVVFDIGAQAERVREKGRGIVLPYSMIDDIKGLNDTLLEISSRVEQSGP